MSRPGYVRTTCNETTIDAPAPSRARSAPRSLVDATASLSRDEAGAKPPPPLSLARAQKTARRNEFLGGRPHRGIDRRAPHPPNVAPGADLDG